jgi:MFS family permease
MNTAKEKILAEKQPRKRVMSAQYMTRLEERKMRERTTYDHFEEVLERIKPFGVYQIFACFCIIFAQIEWAGNFSFVNIVGSAEPDWICTLKSTNLTITVKHDAPNKCDYFKNQCSTFVANKSSTDFNSIVATFKMICDDKNKPEYIQIVLACSMLVGSIIGGHLGDWYGRQFLFYMCQLGIVITSCMTTAARDWQGYSVCQALNGIMYGMLEVESITLLMEYTNNRYRMIPNACYQANIANMVIALIAYLTKDWQLFFVFLNLVASPIIMAFMLFHESPRWLLATGRISKACNVLNDIANRRWNGTEVIFTTRQLEHLKHETKRKKYNFYHLFNTKRFFKQSLMQILAMLTYSMVSICYLYVVKDFTDISPILLVFLDGCCRLIIPIIIIILDYNFRSFDRRTQFLGSLSLMAACFIAVNVLVATNHSYTSVAVATPLIVGAMINDSAFWMNIVQVTTQRYPTVIRCIAFGCLHSVKHIGTIAGILIMHNDLLKNDDKKIIAFIVPGGMILATLIIGYFIQPDTKGKALLDTMDDLDVNRLEKSLPNALMRLATLHRVVQTELHNTIVQEHSDEWKERLQKLDEEQNQNQQQNNFTNEGFIGDNFGNNSTTTPNIAINRRQ